MTKSRRTATALVEVIACVFAVFTLCGCGAEPVLHGVAMPVMGIPVFIWQRQHVPAGGNA
jgi:hypothetical protein